MVEMVQTQAGLEVKKKNYIYSGILIFLPVC